MDQPAEIVTEQTAPVSTNVPLPVPAKKPSKNFLILLMVLFLASGLVYAGMQIGKKQSQISVLPTPIPTEVLVPTSPVSTPDCQGDSDCVLVMNIKKCCSCPFAVNKEELEKNKDLIKWPKITLEEIPTPPGGCKDIVCSPCPRWDKAVCESGVCKEIADLTPTLDSTVGWKTYTYPSKTGESYAVKYPSSWTTLEAGGVEGISVEFKSDNGIGSVSIFRSNKYNKEPIDQWLIDKKIISSLAEAQDINVGDVVGKKLIQHKEGLGDVYLPYDQYLFIFTNQLNSANQSVFNQILSTFKFLE